VKEALKIRAVEGLSYAAALRKGINALNAAEADSTGEAESIPPTQPQAPTVAQVPPPALFPLPPMLGAAEARNVTVEFLENSKTSPWRALINPRAKQPQAQPEAEKAMEVKLSHFMVALLT